MADRHFRKAWVVTVDMGYGHERASHALNDLAYSDVIVANNYPGIPEAERERVFDRFFRGAGATGYGSGLGLSIVRAVALRHGAQVDLGDAPGGGLRVSVRFPRR